MCEAVTLERITQAVRGLSEPMALRVLDFIEDLTDIVEANARLSDPLPPIPMDALIHEFGLDDSI